jgi:nucleotide-binding universal stress UspA family protein
MSDTAEERALIVHPTDLLSTSEAAFYHALKLGLATHGRLALVHLHDRGDDAPGDLDGFPHVRETLARWGVGTPAPAADRGAEPHGLQVSKGEFGRSEAAFGRLLHEEHPELVVLGTRALDGLQRLFEGSFAETLSRRAHAPTLFVPKGAAGFVDHATGAVAILNVLVPVAEDPAPDAAIAAAVRLCERLGQTPTFHLLHVGDGDSLPPYRLAYGRERREIIRGGPVVDAIVEVADQIDADLIAMATAGHKGFLDALFGSTTEGVLRKARRPLLAAPVNIGD